MVFADPPYFLSGGGISYQSGKIVCVDKGVWDKPTTPEELDAFNLRWLSAVREHMKDNATIWISGTHHNIFSVQQQLLKLGFKILNGRIQRANALHRKVIKSFRKNTQKEYKNLIFLLVED